MPDHSQLLGLVPAPGDAPDWAKIWPLWSELAALDTCPQDPVHHAEGDAGTHTRMVVEALVADTDWQALEAEARTLLFWAAVLHDIGKPATTKTEEDGRVTSRGHSRTGTHIARDLLWNAESPFHWREALCGIILSHQLPFWLLERPEPTRLAIETSFRCRADWLCLHALADAKGRVCDDQQTLFDNIALTREAFAEAACLDAPFPFANAESRVTYFERPDRDPHYAAHETFRCNVTVMSGLPGAGKDTWIAHNAPDLPMVSLDAVRAEMGVKPTDDQGRVVQAAQESAREHLRAGRDFVWNGTNVTRLNRGRILRILRDYGARIRIVYVEPRRTNILKQNRGRTDAVPDAIIAKLAGKLEPPALDEAHEVLAVV